MSNTNTGGPACSACGDPATTTPSAEKIDMRDYFAAKAMGGMCTGAPLPQKNELDLIARRSYEMADTMLKAREVGSMKSEEAIEKCAQICDVKESSLKNNGYSYESRIACSIGKEIRALANQQEKQ